MNAVGMATVCSALIALACSGSTSGTTADLPAGWETAKSVQAFSQSECSGSHGDPAAPSESIDVTVAARSISVAYHQAHFRCAQAVRGFVRLGSQAADFLVQATDMNPSTVARCDCLYEVTLGESVPSGPTTVTVYRRWDHYGGNPIDPLKIGTASVTVP